MIFKRLKPAKRVEYLEDNLIQQLSDGYCEGDDCIEYLQGVKSDFKYRSQFNFAQAAANPMIGSLWLEQGVAYQNVANMVSMSIHCIKRYEARKHMRDSMNDLKKWE